MKRIRNFYAIMVCLYIVQIAVVFSPGSTIRTINFKGDGVNDRDSLMRIEQSQVKYASDFFPLVGLFSAIGSCRWECSVLVNSITVSFEQDSEFFLRGDDLSARQKDDFIEVWTVKKKIFAIRHSDVVVF